MTTHEKAPTQKPESKEKNPFSAPAVELPKGGGAIRGIGEKFAANPVTGTGSMTVPIPTSPGRSGFGPQLALSYDSGAGNGPFGFGWSLSLPSITRKTDKGLPQYYDAEESDVFILSGSEDLVPVFKKDSEGKAERDLKGNLIFDEPDDDYSIRLYRPRIEGLFARIERWTHLSDGDVHWRSISRDNILTLYGKDENSRIADPEDKTRIFSWLISETRDDRGNAVVYEYKPEDSVKVDLMQTHERNRGDQDSSLRTANRYIKHILYGNRIPLLDPMGHRPRFLTPTELENAGWMFEVVFDYGEHHLDAPTPADSGKWFCRHDPFSSYRASFEVRNYRLCQRILMFHHFPEEKGVGQDCLVRSTEFIFRNIRDNPDDLTRGHPIASFIASVIQSGYKRSNDNSYLKKSLPPLEFEYSEAIIQEKIESINPDSLENLPVGIDGIEYQWLDLFGEGISGIFTEQDGGWFYKRNLSPIVNSDGKSEDRVRFGPIECIRQQPNVSLHASGAQFMDLAGDGQPDVVIFNSPTPGFFEVEENEEWAPFRPFMKQLNLSMSDPNLKFIDLNGDGHADALVTEDQVFTWYPSLAEEGFGPGRHVAKLSDEEAGPAIVFADPTQSIYLADMSGDGLNDIVRIRNGEICYWPNLGYGRFCAKITMDNSPRFDTLDIFDQRRIRVADIDGSGTIDILYLAADGVHIYSNQSGNAWSNVRRLESFPAIDNLVSITAVDLLSNGTACLVWSSPLPDKTGQQMRYIDLMGGKKPHLLTKIVNNLGAETRIEYASSTKFYLCDKLDGKPWITRLPFPVHIVEQVEIYDYISRNRFVARYAYHHGYFDGIEREFRGFGMVEQWDTEAFEVLLDPTKPIATNINKASHVPPVHTKTWFHTGIYLGRDRVSNFFAGLLDEKDVGEYYPSFRTGDAIADATVKSLLLDDTILPTGILELNGSHQPYQLSFDEEREACRALKGSMLCQEIYALDGSDKEKHPYTITEQNFTIELLQECNGNQHAIFFSHPRETINYHYERNPIDPRINHALVLEVDGLGNIRKDVAISYGRRQQDMDLPPKAQDVQSQTLITYTENEVTNLLSEIDDYRTPLPSETRTYELTGYAPKDGSKRFEISDFVKTDPNDPHKLSLIFDKEINYEVNSTNGKQRRLIEHVRSLYRQDNLTGPLPLHKMQSMGLPYESYKLAFTPGLIDEVFSGRVTDIMSQDEGRYVHSAGDANWWIPSGRIFYSPNTSDTSEQELAYARAHFFQPHRYRDPFHNDTFNTENFVTYDKYDFLVQETRDALGNRMTAGERDETGNLMRDLAGHLMLHNDYRVLQPSMVMDPNRNRSAVSFDALGLVVGTAVMGKPEDNPHRGDVLDDDFNPDLSETEILPHLENPLANPHAVLQRASTRMIYDLFAYYRTKDQLYPQHPQPTVVYTLVRETHDADLVPSQQTIIQHQFSYSDGFGREIQKKIQAEAGPVPKRDPTTGRIIVINGQPEMTLNSIIPRWVGSGWAIFNNKGKPVRQYEPFFSDTHHFEFEVCIGVSPILFYDPLGRVVTTLHPNHSWEKIVFDPWQQKTWDVNDTVKLDPRTDADVKGSVEKYFALQPTNWKTWLQQRIADLQNPPLDTQGQNPEQDAAVRTLAHANTPTCNYFDSLGRSFLIRANNGKDMNEVEQHYFTRLVFNIEGNERQVVDAKGRVVMRYDYDMLSNRIHQASMEAGELWMLNDITGKPIRIWDSRGHQFRSQYDQLRRPIKQFVSGSNPVHSDSRTLNRELLIEKIAYGEAVSNALMLNLRTRAVYQWDSAGVLINESYDFKGNLLRSSRQIAQDYKAILNWADSVTLETDSYHSSTTYDSLNRPLTLTSPDNSVIRYHYNEARLLDKLDANLRSEKDNNQQLLWTSFITNVDYDAKGQRTLIQYGNGAETSYSYDRDTFRLIQLYTRRGATFTEDCGADPPPPRTAAPPEPPPGIPCGLQNLYYTYDPGGNITNIRDAAQQSIYFRNQKIDANNDYSYDALYRLIEATGREHLGQGGSPVPHSYNDSPRLNLLHPNDRNAMGRYRETYQYDEVGNFIEMRHRGMGTDNPVWSRLYEYLEPSLLEPDTFSSNRLTRTLLNPNGAQPIPEDYAHDPHGNMTCMPQLQVMEWDFHNRLSVTQRQAVNVQDEEGSQYQGERTYYVYDAAGQRVRKVIELAVSTPASSAIKDERIYLGGFEIYQKHGRNALTRETLHVMDDKQRIVMVEMRTQGNESGVPERLIRYQFSNHLGSVSLELDDKANIVSYEEYTPYGSTSYQAVRNQTETPKRYRYTGKERDEESGLYYHGARYYAPWLGRWTSCDPIGIKSELNLYRFCYNNPCNLIDLDGCDPTPNQQRFRQIFNEINSDDRENAHARTLIQAFRDVSITGSTPRERLTSILDLTRTDAWVPSASKTHFNSYTIRDIGTGDPPVIYFDTLPRSHTKNVGDFGFRPELRDSVFYGSSLPMNTHSSDQIGHFLTAVDMGLTIQKNKNEIEKILRFKSEHWFLSAMTAETDNQRMAALGLINTGLLRAMIGHEQIHDITSVGSFLGNGFPLSDVGAVLSPSPKEIDNFLNGKLELIKIGKDVESGNSYQDLLLTWVGYSFGVHMANYQFADKGQAALWLEYMITSNKDSQPIDNNLPDWFKEDVNKMREFVKNFGNWAQ